MTFDPVSVALVFLAGMLVGLLAPLLFSSPDDGPKDATVTNYLTVEPALLDWMRGNRRELTLHRLAAFRTFKLKDFVTPHLLTDGEWRRAKHELIGANVLEIKHGTTASLSQAGSH